MEHGKSKDMFYLMTQYNLIMVICCWTYGYSQRDGERGNLLSPLHWLILINSKVAGGTLLTRWYWSYNPLHYRLLNDKCFWVTLNWVSLFNSTLNTFVLTSVLVKKEIPVCPVTGTDPMPTTHQTITVPLGQVPCQLTTIFNGNRRVL